MDQTMKRPAGRPTLRLDVNPRPVFAPEALAAGVPEEDLKDDIFFAWRMKVVEDGKATKRLENENRLKTQTYRSNAWVEADIPGGWTAAYRLAFQKGIPVISELRVFPKETWSGAQPRPPGLWSGDWRGTRASVPPGGLNVGTLRRVKLTAYLEQAEHAIERLVRSLRRNYGSLAEHLVGAPWQPEPRPTPSPRGPGRPRRSDHELAVLAKAYSALRQRGIRRIWKELAERYEVSPDAIRGRIHEARLRGLLPRSKQGAPRGGLTAKARALLKKGHRARH
jgi:hypothetical protein